MRTQPNPYSFERQICSAWLLCATTSGIDRAIGDAVADRARCDTWLGAVLREALFVVAVPQLAIIGMMKRATRAPAMLFGLLLIAISFYSVLARPMNGFIGMFISAMVYAYYPTIWTMFTTRVANKEITDV